MVTFVIMNSASIIELKFMIIKNLKYIIIMISDFMIAKGEHNEEDKN